MLRVAVVGHCARSTTAREQPTTGFAPSRALRMPGTTVQGRSPTSTRSRKSPRSSPLPAARCPLPRSVDAAASVAATGPGTWPRPGYVLRGSESGTSTPFPVSSRTCLVSTGTPRRTASSARWAWAKDRPGACCRRWTVPASGSLSPTALGQVVAGHLLEVAPERVRQLVQDQRLEPGLHPARFEGAQEPPALRARRVGGVAVDEDVGVEQASAIGGAQDLARRRPATARGRPPGRSAPRSE
jgi:hypothetical protein